MTKGGRNAKSGFTDADARGRLQKARAFHIAAVKVAEVLIEQKLDCSPVLSNATLAAIAYADAVTITSDQKVNQSDHATALAVLRDCIGNQLPDGRANELKALLSVKSEVQYGAKYVSSEQGIRAVAQLEGFAAWAVAWLAGRGMT